METIQQIPVIPAIRLFLPSVYPFSGIDYIWAHNQTSQLFCGTQASVQAATAPSVPGDGNAIGIAAGSTGLWVLDGLSNLYHTADIRCNNGQSFLSVPVVNVAAITSTLTGIYYFDIANQAFYLNGPLASPVNVMAGGPTGVVVISASNIDDSLTAVDFSDNIWILSGPTGTRSNTGIFKNAGIFNYNISNLYARETLMSGGQAVNHVTFGLLPYFAIPVYVTLSRTLQSSLPSLVLYQAVIATAFDDCNNSLLDSWTVKPNYRGIGTVTATLRYTADFPNGSSQDLSSTVTFVMSPDPKELLSERKFCPVNC